MLNSNQQQIKQQLKGREIHRGWVEVGVGEETAKMLIHMCVCVCVCVCVCMCVCVFINTHGRIYNLAQTIAAFYFALRVNATYRKQLGLGPYFPRTCGI